MPSSNQINNEIKTEKVMKKTYQKPVVEDSDVCLDNLLFEGSLPVSDEEIKGGYLSRDSERIWGDDDE